MVYKIGDRRCCTFIKKRIFYQLVQALLKLRCGIEDRLRSVISSVDFGLSVKVGDRREYIPSVYIRKFFERYNTVALERIPPNQECDKSDMYGMCLNAIASIINWQVTIRN